MIELFHELAELSAVLARTTEIRMEEHAPAPEPEAVDEFPEVEGWFTFEEAESGAGLDNTER